jgi:hypothetical protein
VSNKTRFSKPVLSGKSEGSAELILKAKFTITPEASGLPFTMLRVKYPLIPAYCLSVHGQEAYKRWRRINVDIRDSA